MSKKQVNEQALAAAVEKLNSLNGLENVKKTIIRLVKSARILTELGENCEAGRFIFVGEPGTGKTTVARILGELFAAAGVLTDGHTVTVTPSELIGEYMGQSALKTEAVCKQALGGVLIVDEAHLLIDQQMNAAGFAQEVLFVLLEYTEAHRDNFCLVLIGYELKMKEMLMLDMGLRARFQRILEFEKA